MRWGVLAFRREGGRSWERTWSGRPVQRSHVFSSPALSSPLSCGFGSTSFCPLGMSQHSILFWCNPWLRAVPWTVWWCRVWVTSACEQTWKVLLPHNNTRGLDSTSTRATKCSATSLCFGLSFISPISTSTVPSVWDWTRGRTTLRPCRGGPRWSSWSWWCPLWWASPSQSHGCSLSTATYACPLFIL